MATAAAPPISSGRKPPAHVSELYCVSHKVCRCVPYLVPVCPPPPCPEPCCPTGPVSEKPSLHERLQRCLHHKSAERRDADNEVR